VSKKYVAKSISGDSPVTIPADQASILVEIPAGVKIVNVSNRLVANGITISYK
jgi:hypothetical protein